MSLSISRVRQLFQLANPIRKFRFIRSFGIHVAELSDRETAHEGHAVVIHVRNGRGYETQKLPSLSYRGFQSWPPVWMREFGPETYPVGEVGILEDVHKSTENYCYLVITYNGSRYVGVIQCDDQDFFKKLYRRLTHACGHPVRRARHRSKLMDHTTTPQVGFAQLRFVGRTTDCARSGASDGTFSGTIYGRSVLPEPRKEQERARLQQFAQI